MSHPRFTHLGKTRMGSHPRFTHLGKTRMKIKKRLLWPKNHFKSLIRVLPIWVKRG